MFKRKDKEQPQGLKTKLSFVTVILLIVLVLYVLSLIVTLSWALMTSFKESNFDFNMNVIAELGKPKPGETIKDNPNYSWFLHNYKIGIPFRWMYTNYVDVFEQFQVPISTPQGERWVGLGEMFLNSFLYAIGCAFTSAFVPCITAYLCAKFKYKFSNVIYVVVLVTMILPIVGSLPSEIRVATALGLYDQIWGLWLMKAHFLGLYFLVFYGVFSSQPKAYVEAAKIDGAGNFTIMTRISLPLAVSTFITVMLINFIGFWNDYQTPMIYLPSYPTAALGVFRMATTTINEMSEVYMRMAAATIVLVPVLVIFLCFHKRLLGNVTVGGIKG